MLPLQNEITQQTERNRELEAGKLLAALAWSLLSIHVAPRL